MTLYARSGIHESQQDHDSVLKELKQLESLEKIEMTDDLIEGFFGELRILHAPMFIETIKNHITKGSVSLSRSNLNQYPHLHIVQEDNGELIAYVYKSKEKYKYSTLSDVFHNYYQQRENYIYEK